MRPSRLEIEGFSAFNKHTVVDFEGADLFAFAGPTGSGKSSLIDALCVALYGSVPRLGNVAKLLPVININASKATVRLDFTVAGVPYTVARVIQRRGANANTTECRLEQGEHVLGTDVKSVEAEIVRLLGLSFGDFTKAVVLPQGDFATFLHASSKERQAVLVGLLGLGDYDRVGYLAGQRRKSLEERVKVLAGQADAEAVSDEALAAAATRVGEIEALETRAAELEPDAARLNAEAAAARDAQAQAEARHRLVSTLRLPASARDLSRSEAEAVAELAEGEAVEASALEAVTEAREQVTAAGERLHWQHLLQAHEDLARHDQQRAQLAAQADRATTALDTATGHIEAARTALDDATARLNEVRQANRAVELVKDLRVGAACPVCQQEVHDLPPTVAAPAFDQAKAAEEAAKVALDKAAQQQRKAEGVHARTAAALEAHDVTAGQRRQALEGRPDADACRAGLQAAVDAETAARAAGEEYETRRRRTRRLRDAVDAARKELDGVRKLYFQTRETLTAMGPPVPTGELDDDWTALQGWAVTQAETEQATVGQHRAAADDATARAAEVTRQLADLLAAAGVRPDQVGAGAGAALARAAERARGEHQRLVERNEEVDAKRQLIAADEAAAATAGRLAGHLRVTNFEAWMLRSATEALIEGANIWLERLVPHTYSLYLSDRDLGVIDHRNASQRRGVRTLSGGETFLASLALALALAERVTELAGAGGRRLESMFLDEGFGTLDPDTLDQVAGALEELQSDRMVGIVTHVTSLSERMPVRFMVRAEPGSSVVQRVEG